ncbi:hypothetical protein PAMA_001056 [Pampus argenteus]
MSAAQNQSTLEAKLGALQCHFTWDIDPSRSKLFRLRDNLEDIGTEEGISWLGHIYNLQGYIHYQLGFIEGARRFFSRATEALPRSRNHSDEGPWLVVNYGNLAWLHHHLGEQTESQTYLSKVDTLLNEYPSPSQDELHPEIYAEKAWTLMKFGQDKKMLAADYFQRAIRMQPDVVEWHTSHVLALVNALKHCDTPSEEDIHEKMKMAKEHDPENLYIAVHELEQRAKKGESIEDEARELARKVLRNPVSSYSGIKALLRLYTKYVSVDEAIDLAEEALKNHPDERYLKRCAALCYKWRIVFHSDPKQSMIDRAVSLHKEVISLYPHGSLVKKLDLASIYAKSNHGLAKAEQIYQELLERDLEPIEKQMFYHYYAKYLNFDRQDRHRSEEYHMRVAEMPQQTFFRENSIKCLKKIKERNRSRSAAQNQSTLEAKLGALQCHFTWDIDPSRSKLFRLRDNLEDIGTEEGISWLGHIYNLQGYIHYQLGFIEDARRFFSRATEAFRQMRNTVSDEGPWLVVNYGNLAWLHHHLGEQAESQTYLSKVDTLLNEYPSPSQDELHPEIYAEKAWTLMKFGKNKSLLAADYFQRAIRMQPDVVEWHTSYVLTSKAYAWNTPSEEDIHEKMKMAKEKDPENLYIAVHELEQRAKKGESIEDEARELARKVLRNPVSSYSGIKPLLWNYGKYVSVDEAIDLAEEALKNHPDERYLKRCAALCYKWRIFSHSYNPMEQSMIDRAVSLHKEVISLYPHGSLVKKLDLAYIYAKSNHGLAKADQIYQELLERDLEPIEKQMFYHYYAKYLNFDRQDRHRSEEYHMRVAEMPQQTFFRENSIKFLKNNLEKYRSRRHREVEELLATLGV